MAEHRGEVESGIPTGHRTPLMGVCLETHPLVSQSFPGLCFALCENLFLPVLLPSSSFYRGQNCIALQALHTFLASLLCTLHIISPNPFDGYSCLGICCPEQAKRQNDCQGMSVRVCRNLGGNRKMFFTFISVVVPWLYSFVKTYWNVHLKWVCFIPP